MIASFELKDGHPATSRHVYGPDDPNVGSIDPILPNNPAIITRVTGLTGLQILS